jgi:GPH family glycoside/pentoside/hexuronide:cation symporter
MVIADSNTSTTQEPKVSRWTKIIYGSGDWGRASFNTIRQFFYAIFLTDVVGLDARLASFAALISILWDAINDPIVGALSDNVRTRWGRRRPFLLIFSVPFILAFVLLWWAPTWKSQFLLMLHVTLAYMVSDTIQTLITVPYLALTPEIASGYDDRTSLTSYRMFFNLVASLVTAVAAPSIMDAAVHSGTTLQQAYLIIAALFGSLAAIPYILVFFFVREGEISQEVPTQHFSFTQVLTHLWKNTPFRFATGIYVLNWIAVDLEGLMIPFFLLYWIAQGDLLAKVNLFGVKISLESVVLGFLLLSATLAIPFWSWFAKLTSKRMAYIVGMSFWVVVQFFVFGLQPGQVWLIILFVSLAGLSVSTAHIIPDAIFPDVIDWDEFTTNARREGLYYGAINFIRKLSSALAIFLALQALGWFGYQSPPKGAMLFTQPPQAILAIRVMTGPFIVVLLILAILFAWGFPITRERQNRVRLSLLRRRKKKKAADAIDRPPVEHKNET